MSIKKIFNRPVVLLTLLVVGVIAICAAHQKEKATLWIIGDSTVKNGSGKGDGGLWGWGDYLAAHFDTTRLKVVNKARGGRSSRTYQTEGLWNDVLAQIKPGDFVLMQFGHNDGGPMATGRARASIKGNNNDTVNVVLEATGKKETVHSYGWYMRKYIADAKAKGAAPIVLSPIPRNIWNEEGEVARNSNDYGKWAKEAAEQGGGYFIDLNKIVADHYEKIGEQKVRSEFFLKDHTHTTKAGAILNAASVVEGLKMQPDCPLNNYLKQ